MPTVTPAYGRRRGETGGRNLGGHGGSGFGRARVREDIDEELAASFGGLGM